MLPSRPRPGCVSGSPVTTPNIRDRTLKIHKRNQQQERKKKGSAVDVTDQVYICEIHNDILLLVLVSILYFIEIK